MDNRKFFKTLGRLGMFSCRNHKRIIKQQEEAAWHNHYGNCLNGSYHFCRFLLEPEPVHHLIYYHRKDEVRGELVRYRSGFSRPGRPRTATGFRSASRRLRRR